MTLAKLANGLANSRQESAMSRVGSVFLNQEKPFLMEQMMLGPSPTKMNAVKGSFLALLTLALVPACGHMRYIAGTTIPATETNQEIINTIEQYRMLLMEKNVDGLILLASNKYFEDGGTPDPSDDYGYDGLQKILNSRLQRVQSIRYDIRYRHIWFDSHGHAIVDAFLSGAFELEGEVGDRYRRISDYHRFVLERSTAGGTAKWKFLAGM